MGLAHQSPRATTNHTVKHADREVYRGNLKAYKRGPSLGMKAVEAYN